MAGAGIAGAKNSFSTSVKVGNWVEDNWGRRHAESIASRHAHAQWESSAYASNFTAPVGAHFKLASAPAPVDALDGHLVMAHGTNIIEREPEAGHFMSM
jgi:hypothetical protein